MADSVESVPHLISPSLVDLGTPTRPSPVLDGAAYYGEKGSSSPNTEEERKRRQDAERRNAQMEFEKYWNSRKTFFTPEQREQAWDATAHAVKKYSDEMVDRWNKEIDTLLVYAGLFSAILTAFNVQSYQLLTPPAPDPVVSALQQISAQLSSFSVNTGFVNATQPAFVLHQPQPLPAPRSAVWLNALWFSSLIFSLSAASVGIMVKQWLNEYTSGISGKSRQLARLRQHRLNALMKWRVAEIVGVLPVLLQVASALFFAGLLVLLWNLDSGVAIVATVLVGVLGAFSLTTMALPAFTRDCSYRSPPAYAIFKIMRPVKRAFYSCCRRMVDILDWVEERLPTDTPSFLGRLSSSLLKVDDSFKVTLRGKEMSLVSSWTDHLDANIVSMAYTTTMNPRCLDDAAICFADLSPSAASRSARTIFLENLRQWGQDRHTSMMRSVRPCMWSGVIAALLARTGQGLYSAVEANPSVGDDLRTAYDYIYWMASHGTSQLEEGDAAALRLLCMDYLNILLYRDICELPTDVAQPDLPMLNDLSNLLAHKDTVLGTAVRHSVAVRLEGFIRKRVARWKGSGEQSYAGWYSTLRCLVFCVPKEPSQDHKPGDEAYEAARLCAREGLKVFAQLLHHPLPGGEGVTTSWQINDILHLFQECAAPVGIISPQLVQGMALYLHSYERDHGTYQWEEQRKWILELERDLHTAPMTPAAAQVAAMSNSSTDAVNAPRKADEAIEPKQTADDHVHDSNAPPILLSSQTPALVHPDVAPAALASSTPIPPTTT